ncbi:ABC transporter substrate-binding protein [Candidimonas sp. SYP-B2681]|uniref:MlaC/ttg2D family ABC transporter substrate-binding protein n=1 Tax=Candidimonas sp. SYP-B2681 TaxID=2497686 RepID=UPI000F889BE2|nr:ABC transporter substrate-binding protein [Candidimonas sp. SYP-B2681]RTZ43260.1 ABC transporter substrate-binding protein [Candidimonas sp. SYP-B2681]
MFKTFSTLLSARRLLGASFLCLAGLAMGSAHAQDSAISGKSPSDFVQTVANNALDAIKRDQAVKAGDLVKINQVVNQYVLPYVNLEKTTRLAAGRHWRTATPKQQQELVQAFKGTLIRTYSGAFTKVDQRSSFAMLPFRGDINASDLVVRSTLSQANGPAVGIDYRLEKTPQGWKIYDLNVEGIWLIQNYRNQFAQQISQNGVDGLIAALNQRNQ